MGLPPYIQEVIGQRFNKLVPQRAWSVRLPSGKVTYKAACNCDCGGSKDVFVNALTQHRTGSCGCDKSRYEKTSGSKNYRFKGYEEIRAGFWNGYKESARVRKIPFEITMKYAWGLYEAQGRKCTLSGVPIGFGPNRQNSLTTASLDRLDNSKGYVEGNVQWVHKVVNIMRNVLSIPEFLVWCEKIARRNQKASIEAA